MGIGGSIFLIALGAIIAFGVETSVSWLNLNVVGWVIMLAGATGLFLTLYVWNRRRAGARTVEERRYYNGRATPAPRTTPAPPSQAERTAPTEPVAHTERVTRTERLR